jgi:hypothetical protein
MTKKYRSNRSNSHEQTDAELSTQKAPNRTWNESGCTRSEAQ